jgi:hypothetical protein
LNIIKFRKMVELKRGDRVKFLNDTGSGIVTRIIDKEMVMVKTDDGFEYPVLGSELLKGGGDDLRSAVAGSDSDSETGDGGRNSAFTAEEEKEKEKEIQGRSNTGRISGRRDGSDDSMALDETQSVKPGLSQGGSSGSGFYFKGAGSAGAAAIPDKDPDIYIAVVPFDYDEPVGGEVSLFIINDSDWSLLYHVAVIEHGKIRQTVSAGMIEPGIKINCGDYHIDDLFGDGGDAASGGVEITIVAWGEVIRGRAVVLRQLVNPGRKFLSARAAYMENDFFDEDAFLLKVVKEKELGGDTKGESRRRIREQDTGGSADYDASEASLKIAGDKAMAGMESVQTEKKERGRMPREIDLHIGEIVDNSSELTPGEIINIQLARFRTSLEGAIISKERSVVYIHGTGAGKLKHEIRRIIDREYQTCTYQDASFREYGYGATLVIVKNRR